MKGREMFRDSEDKEPIKKRLNGAKDKLVKGVNPGFWKEVVLTLSPRNYSHLPLRGVRKAFSHLLAVLLASFVIMSIIAIPNIIHMPGYIRAELSKFEKLNVSIDYKMSSPVIITSSDPQVIIDNTGKYTELGPEKALITGDSIYFRPFAFERKCNLSEFEDITSKKDEFSSFLSFLIIILIPTLLIAAYAMFLVKYALTILAASVVLFLIARIVKKDLGFGKSLNIALFASTPMIFIEVILIPFSSKYLIPIFQLLGMNFYAVTLLVYVSLIFFGSYFASKTRRGNIEWGF